MITVPYEVKKALRDGMLRKNYRFIVLNDDGTEDFTIDNDTLVSETVSIDERMCSDDTIKFGLCEGSSLEFQYFNHPNITGRRVQIFIDVDFDERVEAELITSIKHTGNIYWSEEYRIKLPGHYVVSEHNNLLRYVVINSRTDPENVSFTEQADHLMVAEFDVSESDLAGNVYTIILASYGDGETANLRRAKIVTHSIPMGFFDVKSCSRQASTGIMKATAYNKLQSEYLDAKANELIDEAYANIDRTYTPNPTIDDVLRYVLADFAIVKSIPKALTESSSSSTYQIVKEQTFPPVLETRYSGKATLTTEEKLPTYCEWHLNPAQAYVNYFYVDGGVQIVVKGLNSLKEYVRTHDCAVTDSGSKSHFKISCTYGYDDRNSTWATYDYVISLDDDVDEIVTPYFRNYYVSRGGPTPGTKYEASFTIEIPMDKDVSTSSEVIEVVDSLIQNVTCEFLFTEPSAIGSLEILDYTVWPDITLRELQSAIYETVCQFGQLDRTTDLFTGVDLNYGGLYPADTLYPANDLYPGGAALSGAKSMYSKLWADEGNVHKWRYLIVTYKGLDEEDKEVEKTLQKTLDENGTDDYNMSDNWLFKNLVWTDEEIEDYADAMVAKMENITWFPFEMWLAGLPYLETGDMIEIPLNGEVYTSYVLQRQLKGIQNLQDTYINGTLDIF